MEGASLEMPSVLNLECREEPSPWGECIQVEGTVRAKAGASLSVRRAGRVWWVRWAAGCGKEGFVSWGQKLGFYLNCNGQLLGWFKQGKDMV